MGWDLQLTLTPGESGTHLIGVFDESGRLFPPRISRLRARLRES